MYPFTVRAPAGGWGGRGLVVVDWVSSGCVRVSGCICVYVCMSVILNFALLNVHVQFGTESAVTIKYSARVDGAQG